VLSALLVPLVAALSPRALKGALMTVRQAISAMAWAGTSRSTLDRLVSAWGGASWLPTTPLLANTFRRKGRLLLTQIVLVTAGVMCLIVLSCPAR